MKATIVTTITTTVDVDTFEVSHQVDVVSHDVLPQEVVTAAAAGGCRSALVALSKNRINNEHPPKE